MRNYRVDFGLIKELLDFSSQLSVSDGLKELKKVFESNAIEKIDDSRYSNIKSIIENRLNHHEY